MIYLRQSTASQEVMLGPFLDPSDGSAKTGLTIANTDIKLFKAGATSEASKTSGGATHIAAGRYYCVLDATDTDTIGGGEINVSVSGALPVRREFVVLHANVYDWLFGSAAPSTAAPLDAAGVRSALGLASANLDTQLSTIDSVVDSILADTGTDGVVIAGASIDAVWDEVVEGSYTARQLLRGFAAALLAKASGLGTTTATFRDTGDAKDRVTAQVDAAGNRSSVTLDLT